MSKQSKTLQLMSLKLGLSDEERVLCKAAEFERLLQMKSTTNNITDTAKVVICLDLAATMFKVDFDQKFAIKCSGLKTPSYMNCRKIVENVLELNADQLTVAALCLMLQCNVQDLAERILNEFRKQAKMELDMNLPQYVCMAVYQACRISKVKVPKSKLIDKSQLKSSQWSKLDADWTKFTDEKFSAFVKKKRGRPAKNAVIDEEEKMEVDEEAIIHKKEETTEPEIEAYEDWKCRILEKAYKELKKLNKENQNKPKNTPNKLKDTPNKQTVRIYINKHKVSPSKLKETPSKQKDTSSYQKDTPSKLNETPSEQKDAPRKLRETPSKQSDSPRKLLDVPRKLRETPSKQSDSPRKLLDVPRKLRETPSKQSDSPRKLLDVPRKLRETPSKHKDTPSKQKETPSIQREMPSKLTETPSEQRETPSKQKEMPSKLTETPIKQRETLSNQRETPGKQKDGYNEIIMKEMNFTCSPRKSPRKTPQKFEPYQSPVKSKGVRLLFPV